MVLEKIVFGRVWNAGLAVASAFEMGRRVWEATRSPVLTGLVAVATFVVVYLPAELVAIRAAYTTTPGSVVKLRTEVSTPVGEWKPERRPVSFAAAIIALGDQGDR